MSTNAGSFGLLNITIAYPGVLGISASEVVTQRTINVTYNGVLVTYRMRQIA